MSQNQASVSQLASRAGSPFASSTHPDVPICEWHLYEYAGDYAARAMKRISSTSLFDLQTCSHVLAPVCEQLVKDTVYNNESNIRILPEMGVVSSLTAT